MSSSRFKTLVIIALALINLTFLTVIIADRVADSSIERAALENICMVLQRSGVAISPDNVRTAGQITTMRTSRSDDAEAAIAAAILGKTVLTDQGVIYQYNSEISGIAEFYSAGDFEIRVNEGVLAAAGGAIRTVQGLLRDMKIEAAGISEPGPDGKETVTAVSSYRGASIYNCTIDFVFIDGYLRTVKGRYATGLEGVEDGAALSSPGTALLGFLAAVNSNDKDDVSCSYIYSMEPGYLYSVVGSFGEGVITPVWLLTTDTGRFFIDNATGNIRTAIA